MLLERSAPVRWDATPWRRRTQPTPTKVGREFPAPSTFVVRSVPARDARLTGAGEVFPAAHLSGQRLGSLPCSRVDLVELLEALDHTEARAVRLALAEVLVADPGLGTGIDTAQPRQTGARRLLFAISEMVHEH